MMDYIIEPLNYPFMIRGLFAALMVGIVCAMVGVFVVLRGMAFFGDALAHAILPGVALGYLISGNSRKALFWWALGAAVISSIAINAISQITKIKEDTAIGIIFAGMFALGIALISTVRDYSIDLTHFLFGNVLGVSDGDLWLTGIFGVMILIICLAFYKEFQVLAFDRDLALTLRLPVKFLNYLQLILIAMAIVVSLQTVGIALMVAMLITPAAASFLLTKRLSSMMSLAAVLASISGIIGLYASYYLSISSGAAIVLIETLFFVAALLQQAVKKRLLGNAN